MHPVRYFILFFMLSELLNWTAKLFLLPDKGVSVEFDRGSHEITEITMISNNQILSFPILQSANTLYKSLVNVKIK